MGWSHTLWEKRIRVTEVNLLFFIWRNLFFLVHSIHCTFSFLHVNFQFLVWWMQSFDWNCSAFQKPAWTGYLTCSYAACKLKTPSSATTTKLFPIPFIEQTVVIDCNLGYFISFILIYCFAHSIKWTLVPSKKSCLNKPIQLLNASDEFNLFQMKSEFASFCYGKKLNINKKCRFLFMLLGSIEFSGSKTK